MRPVADRQAAWTRLESDLNREQLAAMCSQIELEDVIAAAPDIVAGRVRGRIVVRIG
jgi:acrylyl-CoA reductase (NADPH)